MKTKNNKFTEEELIERNRWKLATLFFSILIFSLLFYQYQYPKNIQKENLDVNLSGLMVNNQTIDMLLKQFNSTDVIRFCSFEQSKCIYVKKINK